MEGKGDQGGAKVGGNLARLALRGAGRGPSACSPWRRAPRSRGAPARRARRRSAGGFAGLMIGPVCAGDCLCACLSFRACSRARGRRSSSASPWPTWASASCSRQPPGSLVALRIRAMRIRFGDASIVYRARRVQRVAERGVREAGERRQEKEGARKGGRE